MATSFNRCVKYSASDKHLAQRLEIERARRRELEAYLRRLCTPQRWAKYWAETTEPWNEISKLLKEPVDDVE